MAELYNGITDVSYRYPKMYVVRPQFFLTIITLLRDAAMNSVAEKLVYNVIQELEANDEDLAASDDWGDYAEKAKARLVGMTATITVPRLQDDKYVFDPVMEDGKALVRPLTAEDIDRIGPACIANVIGVV